MCLDTIKDYPKSWASVDYVIAYKVVRITSAGDKVAPTLISSCVYRDGWQDIVKGKSIGIHPYMKPSINYNAAYHLYEHLDNALKWAEGNGNYAVYICKVMMRDIVAYGEQFLSHVIVARTFKLMDRVDKADFESGNYD